MEFKMYPILIVYVFVLILTVSCDLAPFITPSFPACFVASTRYENVTDSVSLCEHSNIGCSENGNIRYYFYCGEDHECCYHDNCPACCAKRTTLNTAEVAGIVIASCVLAGMSLLIIYFVAGKFCIKKSIP